MISRELVRVATGVLLLSTLTACGAPEADSETRLGTYTDDGASLDVMFQGKLELDESQCVMVSTDQGQFLALFPEGSYATKQGVNDSKIGLIEFGETFDYSGAQLDMSLDAVQIPNGCNFDNGWKVRTI